MEARLHAVGRDAARALPRNVLIEQTLGLVIVLIVGWLGTVQPAIATSD
jgi:putative copper export protein